MTSFLLGMRPGLGSYHLLIGIRTDHVLPQGLDEPRDIQVVALAWHGGQEGGADASISGEDVEERQVGEGLTCPKAYSRCTGVSSCRSKI